jgi:hypothetical protein
MVFLNAYKQLWVSYVGIIHNHILNQCLQFTVSNNLFHSPVVQESWQVASTSLPCTDVPTTSLCSAPMSLLVLQSVYECSYSNTLSDALPGHECSYSNALSDALPGHKCSYSNALSDALSGHKCSYSNTLYIVQSIHKCRSCISFALF